MSSDIAVNGGQPFPGSDSLPCSISEFRPLKSIKQADLTSDNEVVFNAGFPDRQISIEPSVIYLKGIPPVRLTTDKNWGWLSVKKIYFSFQHIYGINFKTKPFQQEIVDSNSPIVFNFKPKDMPVEDAVIYMGGFDGFKSGLSALKNYNTYSNFSGFNTAAFGLHKLYNFRTYAHVSGIAFTGYGTAKLQNLKRYLNALGRDAAVFGTAKVQSLRSYIHFVGLVQSRFGEAGNNKFRISFNLQSIQQKDSKEYTEFGLALVARNLRYVEMNSHQSMERFGTYWASHSPRYIRPKGFITDFPTNHVIATARFLKFEGMDFAGYGARIIPESQTAYMQGFSGAIGEHEIYNWLQEIKPKSFLTAGELPQMRWGWADVYNSDQHIKPIHIVGDKLEPPEISKLHKVENRNRSVQMFGIAHHRFGYQYIYNNARVIQPAGIESPIEAHKTAVSVTHRVRQINMQPIEAPYMFSWHVVHLKAKRYGVKGFNLSQYGSMTLENTRRYFRFITLGEQACYGQHMVSHRIRSVQFESLNAVALPVFLQPELKLGRRYIEPLAGNMVKFGLPELRLHRNVLYPRFIFKDQIGEPIVRNKTPQIYMRSQPLGDFGEFYIGHRVRRVQMDGYGATRYTRFRISDSTQEIIAYSIGPAELSKQHEIRHLGSGLTLPAKIDFSGKGYAAKNFSDDQPPPMKVYQNVIRFGKVDKDDKENGLDSAEFGSMRITANTIRVEPGYWEILFGKFQVTYKNRTVQMGASEDFLSIGEPRMSPHTIYMTKYPPQQAIKNHVRPALPLHDLNGYIDGQSVMPGMKFGAPKATHKVQEIIAGNADFFNSGTHDLQLRRTYITFKGMSTMRFGLIGPLGTQHIEFSREGTQESFGKPELVHVKKHDPYIRPQGFRLVEFGKLSIDHRNRTISMYGLDSLAAGTKRTEDKPYMWQGLRVGGHVPTNIGGGVQSLFGTAWVSLRVRGIEVSGLDHALVAKYEPGKFELAMKVIRREMPGEDKTQRIFMNGSILAFVGAPDIKNKIHYIRPDGNSEQYRKGGYEH